MLNINIESPYPATNNIYTEAHHKTNIKIKEVTDSVFSAICTEVKLHKKARSILPPSKVFIGSIFKAPRKAETKIKYIKKTDGKMIYKIIPDAANIKLTAGPATQIRISFLYENKRSFGVRPAPNRPRSIRSNSTPFIFAAVICPSSWVTIATNTAIAKYGSVIISERDSITEKNSNVTFILRKLHLRYI